MMMMKRLTLLLLVLPRLALAQLAPLAGTTVTATSASAAAVCAGCPVGSTTPADNSGGTFATVVLKDAVPSITTAKVYRSGANLFLAGKQLLVIDGSGVGLSGVALLASANTFSVGPQVFASDTSATAVKIKGRVTGNVGSAFFYANNGTTLQGGVQSTDTGSGDIALQAYGATGGVHLYTGGANHLDVDSAGTTTNYATANFTWNAKSVTTVYGPANTDGFVIVGNATITSGGQGTVSVLSDSSNPPTTARTQAVVGVAGLTASVTSSLICPVKKGDYWEVTVSANGAASLIYWVPNGINP